MAEEHEEEDIPLDEAESVDEDVVPMQKVEIDNKVRRRVFVVSLLLSLNKHHIDCFGEDTGYH